MLEVITGVNRLSLSSIEKEMFRRRAHVFNDQLGWQVDVHDGLEMDDFDRPDTVYIVSRDDSSHQVVGGMRVMPTTKPHMMQTAFAHMFPDYAAVESALTWECTRFFVDVDGGTHASTAKGLNQITRELLVGLVEFGVDNGIQNVLGMFDSCMLRIYRRAGLPPELLDTCKHGKHTLMVGLWDISHNVLRSCREVNGIHTTLFNSVPAPIQFHAA